MYYILYVTVL
uniref:Uncharacterized protein n=1 Tax=Anguilla anguilla TaxID=7936 RepID=A0A0E9W032_ANGAN